MYRQVAAILFPVLLVVFAATAAWGFLEHQDKNAILIKAENQYQRAFHDLNEHMDKLRDELGKSLALNSRRQLSTSMTNIWRLSYAAQSDLGQLPLILMPFDRTQQFIGRVGRFAYDVGVRDLNKKPLSEKEKNTLKTLYQQAGQIGDDLASLQEKVLRNHLRWMDVELAIATEDKTMDNTIVDGFKKVDHTVTQFPEVDWGPTANNLQVRKREKIRKLTGPWISADEAKRRVATALERSAAGMSATLNKGGDLPSYSVRFRRDRDTEVYADVSARGGHLLWMVFDRPVDGRKWTIKQAERKARQFLTRIEYTDMVPISYNETDQIATFNYVHREQGILIYPESVSVKVALDNGEIMGLQANDYLLNRITRPNVRPALTEQEARGQVNPAFRVEKSDLAIIYDKKGNEVLCYDFLGRMDHGQYRVFINAANGEEEYIEKIEKADADLI